MKTINEYHGIALCCEKEPILREGFPFGFKCQVCGNEVGIIPNGNSELANISFAAFHWNIKGTTRDNFEKKLNVEEGWRWASLCFSSLYLGSKKTYKSNFVLFNVDKTTQQLLYTKDGYKYVVDDSRRIKDIKLMGIRGKVSEINIPNFSKRTNVPISIDVGDAYFVGSGETNFHINIVVYGSPKWEKIVLNALNSADICYEIY